MGHYPSGTSFKSVDHYAQIVDSGEFKKFDYGSDTENEKRYGTAKPPTIDLTNIKKVPIAMFVGFQDELADNTDAKWTHSQLKTAIFYAEYSLGHLGLLVGKDMSYFTQDAMRVLNKHHSLATQQVDEIVAFL